MSSQLEPSSERCIAHIAYRRKLANLIPALQDSATRDHALHLLPKLYVDPQNMAFREEMAPLLWHSIGTVSMLLKEVVSVYRLLSTPLLTERVAARVCDALTLFQSVARHPDTKMLFISANIPFYVQPILNTKINERNHEYLRITSLGIFGALVKDDDPKVIRFILKSEVFPCFLNCMELGSVQSKTIAAFIVLNILRDEVGMQYCCVLADRFFAIAHILQNIVEELEVGGVAAEDHPKRLLKHVIGCYHRLSENPRGCEGMRRCLPMKLRDVSFTNIIRDDEQTMQCLQKLFDNVATGQQDRLQWCSRTGRRIWA